jgi:formylglycine-generating enzyme required for sulfatase activity
MPSSPSIGLVNMQGMDVKQFLVLIAVMMALAVSPAQAEKRVALVIGNNDYATLPNLNNAKKDAQGMAAKLRGLGFDVILKVNAGQRALGRALGEFENRIADADVALVFFAGHGIQANGKNHLIPSDAQIEVEEDLRYGSIKAGDFLLAMKRAGAPLNIMILDACRDNPLPRRSRSASRGLSIQPVPAGIKGTTIIYSAAPGQTAQDGPRDGYGVFTGALLKVLEQPGLKLEDVFKKTATRVAALTHGKQDPWINSSVKGNFYFKPGRAVPSSVDKETVFWQSIKDSKDVGDYQDYLAQYPNGSFARIAKRRIDRLNVAQVAAVVPPRPAVPSPAKPAIGIYPQRYKPGNTFRDCHDCPEMVVIPAGSFQMGDLSGDKDEKTVHRVTIPKPLAVGKFEVTQSEYEAVLGTNPSYVKGSKNPVDRVSWVNAKEFVGKLSAKTGKNYRLLSEAEWEYVARAGTATKWHCGTSNTCLNSAAWYASNSGGRSHPVGLKSGNRFGVHDMHGNVWELVEDCYHDSYSGAPSDGSAWTSGRCEQLVMRGGSFANYPAGIRSAARGASRPMGGAFHQGFRVARTLSKSAVPSKPTRYQAIADLLGVTPKGAQFTTGPNEITAIWFEQDFKYNGKDHFVVFIKTLDKKSTCHMCGALLGAITFRVENGSWQVVGRQLKEIEELGSWGDLASKPEPRFLPISGKTIVLSTEASYGGQGNNFLSSSLLAFDGAKWSYAGTIIHHEDNSGACSNDRAANPDWPECVGYAGTISVGKSRTNGLPDLILKKKGTEYSGGGGAKLSIVPAKNQTYKFNGTLYKKVKIRL